MNEVENYMKEEKNKEKELAAQNEDKKDGTENQ
jgi:hypothetical protein